MNKKIIYVNALCLASYTYSHFSRPAYMNFLRGEDDENN